MCVWGGGGALSELFLSVVLQGLAVRYAGANTAIFED